jgi:hypothetical protein
MTFTKQANDPNFYCEVCDKEYANRSKYRYHLRYKHHFSFITQVHPELLPEVDDPKIIVKALTSYLRLRQSYKRHLGHIHKMHAMTPTPKLVRPLHLTSIPTLIVKSVKQHTKIDQSIERTSNK